MKCKVTWANPAKHSAEKLTISLTNSQEAACANFSIQSFTPIISASYLHFPDVNFFKLFLRLLFSMRLFLITNAILKITERANWAKVVLSKYFEVVVQFTIQIKWVYKAGLRIKRFVLKNGYVNKLSARLRDLVNSPCPWNIICIWCWVFCGLNNWNFLVTSVATILGNLLMISQFKRHSGSPISEMSKHLRPFQ